MRPRKSRIAPATADTKYSGHLLLRSVPKTTKTAFKASCAAKNYTMRDVMILLMRKFVVAVKKNRTSINISDLHQLDPDENTEV